MRHHTQDVATFAANTSDVFERSVGIGFASDLARERSVAEHDTAVALQVGERGFITEVIPLHVADGNRQNFPLATRIRERRVRSLYAYLHRLAHILQSHIAHERARQEPRLAENLKPIADTQHDAIVSRKFAHRFHDWRELGDRTRPQVIPVGEPAWHDDRIAIFQIVRLMPQERYRLLRDLLDGPISVVIAIRSGEDQHAKFHVGSLVNRGYSECTMC